MTLNFISDFYFHFYSFLFLFYSMNTCVCVCARYKQRHFQHTKKWIVLYVYISTIYILFSWFLVGARLKSVAFACDAFFPFFRHWCLVGFFSLDCMCVDNSLFSSSLSTIWIDQNTYTISQRSHTNSSTSYCSYVRCVLQKKGRQYAMPNKL